MLILSPEGNAAETIGAPVWPRIVWSKYSVVNRSARVSYFGCKICTDVNFRSQVFITVRTELKINYIADVPKADPRAYCESH